MFHRAIPLLFSGLALTLYTGMRLGLWAPKSTQALAEQMGPAGTIERFALLASALGLFSAALWFFAASLLGA